MRGRARPPRTGHRARTADGPSLTAGIDDLRLATGSAEAVCEKLAHRNVPFIFYTGAVAEPPARFAAAPLIPKPAPPPTILGALRYALSADPRDIVAPLQAAPDLLRAIRDGEERIERVRALIARLEALGSDTSAAQRLLASLHNALDDALPREHLRCTSLERQLNSPPLASARHVHFTENPTTQSAPASGRPFHKKGQHERGRLTASTGSVMRAGRISFPELDAASVLVHAGF